MTTAPSIELESSGVPTAVAKAVRDVYVDSGGKDMVTAVLKRAEDTESALHAYFEWDNDAAAQAYRLSQATDLIRRVKVKVIHPGVSKPIKVRAYIPKRELPAETPDDTTAGSYKAIEEIGGGTAAEMMLLASIERDVKRLQQKYKNVVDFIEVATDILTSEK